MNKDYKKKILHRSKYRGIKELDIIFEKFINNIQDNITDQELIELEQILNLPDNELIDLIRKRSNIYSKALYEIKCDKLTKNEIVQKILGIYESH